MDRLRKGLLNAMLVLSGTLGAFIGGLEQRPSFKQLPESAQREIIKEDQKVRAIYGDACKALENGDLSLAIRQFRNAEDSLPSLAKIDPNYKSLVSTLENFRDIMSMFELLETHLQAAKKNPSRSHMALGAAMTLIPGIRDRTIALIADTKLRKELLNALASETVEFIDAAIQAQKTPNREEFEKTALANYISDLTRLLEGIRASAR